MASLKLLRYLFPQQWLRPAVTSTECAVSLVCQSFLQTFLLWKELKLYGVLCATGWVLFICMINPAACATDAELKALCISISRVVMVPYSILLVVVYCVIVHRLFEDFRTGTLKILKFA